MKKYRGFSLIEIVVFVGILSTIITCALLIGFPEYNRYILSSEKDYLVDTLLESRTRSLVSDKLFEVSTWSNGYCIKDVSGLCVTPVHELPSGMSLDGVYLATSTKMILSLENILKTEINIDQNGFIDGQ